MGDFATGLKDSLEVIAPYLQQIAEKIGEGGQYVFQLYVKQMYIQGISMLIIPVIGIIILIISAMKYKKESKRIDIIKDSNDYKEVEHVALSERYDKEAALKLLSQKFKVPTDDNYINFYQAICMVLVILGAGMIFYGLNHITEILTYLVNPEYKALELLLSQLKG
jgi:hypothetical protein